MAKKKKRGKTSLVTKGINIGFLLLAMSRIIELGVGGNIPALIHELSAGFVRAGGARGSFDRDAALRVYGPMIAAYAGKKGVSMLRKTLRV